MPRVPIRQIVVSWRMLYSAVPGPDRKSVCGINRQRLTTAHARPRHRDELRRDGGGRRAPTTARILSNVVLSQIDEHAPMAAWCRRSPRAAISSISDGLIARALAEAGIGFADLDGVAATAGPGLIGGVIVGLMTAKAIALVRGLPLRRGQPSGRPCADRAADRRRRLSLPAAAGLRRPLPALIAVEGVGDYRRSAPPSTTRSAKPSTRRRSCSASAIPAARRSKAAARTGDAGRASTCRARCSGAARLRFLLLRPEDRGAPDARARLDADTLDPQTSPTSPPRSRRRSPTCWPTGRGHAIARFRDGLPGRRHAGGRRRRRRQPKRCASALEKTARSGTA